MRFQSARIVWVLLLSSYCGLIFWLSAQSHLPVPLVFRFEDKLIHAMAYAVMAALFWMAFEDACEKKWRIALAAVVFCSLYGASDEWHQSFVVGRDASIGDWLADTLGAMLASGIYLRWRHIQRH